MSNWCQTQQMPRGEILNLEQGWQLAYAWYHNRLDPAWQRWPPEEAQRILNDAGLTSRFWQLDL